MTTPGRWTRRALLQLLGTTVITASAGHRWPQALRAGTKPGHQDWAALEKQLQGRLLTPQLPWSNATAAVLQKLRNPFCDQCCESRYFCQLGVVTLAISKPARCRQAFADAQREAALSHRLNVYGQ
jgi:hypothetical protein